MKQLLRIHQSSGMHWVGNGFPVRSVFDYNGLGRELSPFLLLDYAAPYEFAPGNEKRGVGGHPHKGFETVTVAYQGELEHRDSSGGGGKIGAGDVQWMTAGNGIVHEEFHSQDFTHKGGALQMVQLWVNLRAKDKSAKAGYQTLLKAQIPDVPLPQDAGAVRVTRRKFYRLQVPLPRYVRFFLFGLQKQDSGLPKLLGKSHPPAGRRRSRAEDSDSDQDTEAVVKKICRLMIRRTISARRRNQLNRITLERFRAWGNDKTN